MDLSRTASEQMHCSAPAVFSTTLTDHTKRENTPGLYSNALNAVYVEVVLDFIQL